MGTPSDRPTGPARRKCRSRPGRQALAEGPENDRLLSRGEERQVRVPCWRNRDIPGLIPPSTSPSFHLPGRFWTEGRSVRLRAGHRSNPRSKVTSEYEFASAKAAKYASVQRSEERRVGKECRSRWSPSD